MAQGDRTLEEDDSTPGYHGTGEALTQGRFGIGINGWDLLHYTKSLFTDVYWYGNYYAHVQ